MERKSAAGRFSKAFPRSNEPSPAGAATMRPVGSHRMAGTEAGPSRDQIERTSPGSGREDPTPARQCQAPTGAAPRSDLDRRDVAETANQATQTRKALPAHPIAAVPEPASAARHRTDPAPLEETVAAATREEISAEPLSNGPDRATMAASSGSHRQRRNWVHLRWDLLRVGSSILSSNAMDRDQRAARTHWSENSSKLCSRGRRSHGGPTPIALQSRRPLPDCPDSADRQAWS